MAGGEGGGDEGGSGGETTSANPTDVEGGIPSGVDGLATSALSSAAGSSATVGAGASLAQVAGISALTFLAGAGAGVVIDRSVRPPEVVEVPVEVPVERVVEVRVPVVPDAAIPEVRKQPNVRPRQQVGASTLAQEQRLIDSARAQITRSPERALSTLARYRRQFPRGLLAEEAAAIEVLALKSAGHEARARLAAQAFIKKYPKSMFRRRVEEGLQ